MITLLQIRLQIGHATCKTIAAKILHIFTFLGILNRHNRDESKVGRKRMGGMYYQTPLVKHFVTINTMLDVISIGKDWIRTFARAQ